MRSRISGGSLFHFERGVDARHHSLAGGFFVAGRSVDLAGQKEAGDLLRFEGALEFGGIDRVVLDGVAGAQHFGGLKAGNRLENRQLHVDGQRGAHAVDVDFVRVQALGLEEKLVRQSCRGT